MCIRDSIDPENYAGFDEMVNTMVELRRSFIRLKVRATICRAAFKLTSLSISMSSASFALSLIHI